MNKIDSISLPNVEGILEEADEWTRRPGFDGAMQRFCLEMVASHSGSRIANFGMRHTLAWAVSVMIVYLDYRRAEGVTFSEIVRFCEAGGLGSRKAVRSVIDGLLSIGLLTVQSKPGDRRAKRLRPTDTLFELHYDNLAARLAALEMLQPQSVPATQAARRPSTLLAFLGGNVEAYARLKFRLYDQFPEVSAFMDRTCGYIILLDLLRQATAHGGAPVIVEALPVEMAARFHVSRAHVRKLLQEARDNGWFGLKPGGRQIVFHPVFYSRIRLWIGAEFAWMWRLVGQAPELSAPIATEKLGTMAPAQTMIAQPPRPTFLGSVTSDARVLPARKT